MASPTHPVEFRNIGGSFQFSAAVPQDLPAILELDPALWAALSAPVSALNTDKRFLEYLDSDKSGQICLDDVRNSIRFVLKYLRDLSPLGDPANGLPLSTLNSEDADCKTVLDFVERLKDVLLKEDRLQHDLVAAKLAEVTASPFKGDGVLTPQAVAGNNADTLYNAVLTYSGGTPSADGTNKGITVAQLDKFKVDAQAFLDWAETAECPKFRDQDPVGPYDVFQKLTGKLDEYFSFCDLVKLDATNQKRFQLDPASLPPLDLKDPTAVSSALTQAPLTTPQEDGVLDFNGNLNPFYQAALEKFAETFKISTLSKAQYLQLKQDFAPYVDYLGKAHGNSIGSLGKEKLMELIKDPADETLRNLYARDSLQGGVLQSLRTLDMLCLYQKYLMNFINNFVSFKALFSPDCRSLLQAGRLVMDGHNYYLTMVIPNVAAHKAIAVSSNLCLLYLAMNSGAGQTGKPFYVAVAVTGGVLQRIYKGKPAYFISNDNKHYCGNVIDMVDGPISFWNTVFSPFRRLANLIGSRIQKLTDFSTVEKQLETTVNTGKLPVVPAAPAKNGLFSSNGSIFLLAGGLSVAAVGAAFSFLAKSVVSIVESISKMSLWTLIGGTLAILLFIFVPISINAMLKMRRRNLTIFLEAAGWAVNLPMRLNASVSGLFTRCGIYPEGAKFNRTEWVPKVKSFSWKAFLGWLVTGLVLAGLAVAYYLTH